MSTVRDARRALARGRMDEALVALWNALEPLRLRGDRGGLRAVAQMAQAIAVHGDGSQVREAERLLAAVQETLAPEAHAREAAAVQVGGSGQSTRARFEHGSFETADGAYDEVGGEIDVDVEMEGAEGSGTRLGPLLWALILAVIIIINVVSGLLRE